ncbi:M48 family metalloprotease [Streptomyces sp. NPDC051921]|uniref:M48 family metalloprotease n=1 Tax=Streptomyces sp. NPDC051921 TaxID=3155806 RepID=UPI0034252A3E
MTETAGAVGGIGGKRRYEAQAQAQAQSQAQADAESDADPDAQVQGVERAEAAEQDCPACGERIPADRRFVVWCVACGWNVDPGRGANKPAGTRVERLRRRLAHRFGEQLFADLGREPVSTSAPTTTAAAPGGAAGVLAAGLALLVHGITVALAALALWLLIGGWGRGFQPALGALFLALAFALRPRFGSLAKIRGDAPVLERLDAPRLFALLDEVAGAVGTRGVDVVLLDAEANASVLTYGIRQRRALTLGLSLWAVLDRQERVALLGHEFGHYAHGDTRHGVLVGSALRSLDTWQYMLAPNHGETIMDQLGNLLTAVPRLAVHGMTLLLDQATLRASQRAEYLADTSAARVAGATAAAGLMDRLLVTDSAESVLQRETVAARTRIGRTARSEDPAEGLWERVAAQVAAVPEREYERLRRVAELRGHCVDATHPPTHLRRRHVTRGERHPAGVVLDAARSADVDAELEEAGRTVARRVLRDGHMA